jgi:CzcA family heavy metal efflux pump
VNVAASIHAALTFCGYDRAVSVADLGLRHEKFIVFVVAALTVLGVYAYAVMPASIFPNMTFARIDVVADAGNLPPDQVRVAVALPLEHAFVGVPDVRRVLTTSSQGNAELVVEFRPSSNVQTDLTYLEEAIAQARNVLPPDTEVETNIINPNNEPIVSYALTSDTISQTVLHELAQRSMLPLLYGVRGLARISIAGGARREYHVDLNPGVLAAYHLTAEDVRRALAQSTAVTSLGITNLHYVTNAVVLDSNARTVAGIAKIAVPTPMHAAVPISALGSVRLGTAPPTDQVSFDAKHAVILSFYALPGADAVKMAEGIAARVRAISARLPVGVALTRFWDQTTLVKQSQRSLRDAILLGAFLAVLVILVFLRNLRMTIAAGVVIPIAMSITIFIIRQVGETLNLMSVGGLAVAVGLIIDDAIVVIENIARIRQAGPELAAPAAITRAMNQIAPAMIASTLTTVVVFLPLTLLSGVSGFFFRALALTLASALIVSLLLALFATPVLTKWFLGAAAHSGEDHSLITRLLDTYEPALRWALEHRAAIYGASAAIMTLTVLLLSRLPNDFLPRLDEGQFEIGYRLPVGTSLAASDAAAHVMEERVLRDPAVVAVGRWTGIDTNGFSPTPQNAGTLRVRLKPANERAGYRAVSARLRKQLTEAVPSAHFDFHQILGDMINDVSGAPAPIEITLGGPDQRTLVHLARAVARGIESVPGIADVSSGVVYTNPTLQVAPNLRRLAELGWRTSSLGDAIAAGRQGAVAASVPGTFSLIPVRVAVAGDPSALSAAQISTPQGAAPLRSLAQIRPARLSTTIYEENGERVLRVTASIAGAHLSTIVAGIERVLRRTPAPPGYTTSIGGEFRAQQQSFRQFALIIALAVVFVFGVMLATFRSFRQPIVILTAIPLALVGVALGLFVTGTTFNVSSFMGLLLLVGIVVKNGILLIDAANGQRSSGKSVTEALVIAGRLRLRPIVMTTCAAICGLLPLALGLGSGAAMEQPLAIAVIGGLSTATAFTLIVIPVLYAGFLRGEPA